MVKKLLSIIKNRYLALSLWLVYNIAVFAGIIRYRLLLSNTVFLRIIRYLATILWRGDGFLAVIFCISFLYLVVDFINGEIHNKTNKILYLYCLFSLISLLLSDKFINLEVRNYFNFIYSKYGLLKSDLALLNILSIGVLSISTAILSASKYFGRNSLNLKIMLKTPTLLICFLSLFIMISFFLRTFLLIPNLVTLAPKTYNERFENFENIDILRLETPENSKIILPPQDSKWSAISNPPIVQYFLFPRTLISSTYIENNQIAKNIGSAYFVTIIKDKDRNWPEINMKNKTVKFLLSKELNYKDIKLIIEIESGKLYLINF